MALVALGGGSQPSLQQQQAPHGPVERQLQPPQDGMGRPDAPQAEAGGARGGAGGSGGTWGRARRDICQERTEG